MENLTERNRVGSSKLTGSRVFNLDEWSRIIKNLERLEKMRNDSEMAKTTISLVPLSRRTLKAGETVGDDLKKKRENFPDMEPTGKALADDRTKEEIILAAKKILFENKDYARRLLHGLRLSSVLHERNKQVDFNCKLRNMVEAMKREIKLKMIEDAKNFHEEIMRDKSRKKEMKEMIRKELEKQVSQKLEGRRKEEAEKTREGHEIAKMNEKLKSLVKKEQEEADTKKERLKKDIENYTKSESEIRKKLKMKEKEEEEVNEIYQKVAWEIDKRRRDKEKSRFGRTIVYDQKIFRDGREPLKIRSDGDNKLKSFLLMREARKKALLKDILAGKKMAEEEEEKKRNEEKLERRKSAMQRCRKVEADRLRDLREKEERRKVQNSMRKCYLLQTLERKDMEMEEKETDKFYAPDYSGENKMISNFCDDMIQLVKRNRRPVFPVVAAVKDVKKEFGIETVKNLNFLKSNIPINK